MALIYLIIYILSHHIRLICGAYHIPNRKLLELVKGAEESMKLFIYPMPVSNEIMNKAYINNRNSDLDFLLSRYFRQKFSDDDSRRGILVTNPDEANAFLIDHRWGIGTLDGHLKPVINNVIQSYPYFNRSGGHDHFMICTWYTCIYYSPYII